MNDDNNQNQGAEGAVLPADSLPTMSDDGTITPADGTAADGATDNADGATDGAVDNSYLDEYSQDELLAVFAARMLEEKGVEDPDGSKTDALVLELAQAVNQALVQAVPVEQQAELSTKLGDEADANAIGQALMDAGVDITKVTEEALDKFRAEYLGKED